MNLSKCIYFPSLSLLSLLSQLSWRFFWSQDLISSASPISHLPSHASCYYRPGWNELRWRTLYLDSHRTTLNPCCQCKHEVWCSWETSSEHTEYAGPRVSGSSLERFCDSLHLRNALPLTFDTLYKIPTNQTFTLFFKSILVFSVSLKVFLKAKS